MTSVAAWCDNRAKQAGIERQSPRGLTARACSMNAVSLYIEHAYFASLALLNLKSPTGDPCATRATADAPTALPNLPVWESGLTCLHRARATNQIYSLSRGKYASSTTALHLQGGHAPRQPAVHQCSLPDLLQMSVRSATDDDAQERSLALRNCTGPAVIPNDIHSLADSLSPALSTAQLSVHSRLIPSFCDPTIRVAALLVVTGARA